MDDVFDILDNAVVAGSSNAFVLQEIDDRGIFLPIRYERGAPGTFKPGRYITGKPNSICFLCSGSHCSPVPQESQESGVEIFQRPTRTFSVGIGEVLPMKKAQREGRRHGNQLQGVGGINKGAVSTLCQLKPPCS